MKEIELIIGDEINDMISAMSLVGSPAIELDMLYFNKDKNNYVFGKVIDEEQSIIASPALLAEKRIYRYDPNTNEEYNVFFSAETIKKLSQKFIQNGSHTNVTEQHESPTDGVDLIYSWLVYNDQDPIMTEFGFKDIPIGSWCVMYKIENEDIRNKIKSGEINGLSIEAWLSNKLQSQSIVEKQLTDEEKLEMIKDLLKNV